MSEKEDVYRKLQQHLDTGPIGFPRAKSGSDIRLLKAFFNPKEAEFATKLSFFPSNLKSIYRRTKKEGMTLEETKEMLDKLVDKGLYTNKSDVVRDALIRLILEQQVGSVKNTGDSVKEIRETRKKLSKKKVNLDEINSLGE